MKFAMRSLPSKSLLLTALLPCFTLIGCVRPPDAMQVVGAYTSSDAGPPEVLELLQNGTFVHRWEGEVETGKWEVGSVDGACLELTLIDFTTSAAPDAEPVMFGTCVSRNLAGQILIFRTADEGLYKR